MVYSQIPGVVTHGYEELRSKINEIMLGEWMHPFYANSPLMDPFRDGKAAERFRDLLMKDQVVPL